MSSFNPFLQCSRLRLRRRLRRLSTWASASALLAILQVSAAAAQGLFRLVAEMEDPPGIAWQRGAENRDEAVATLDDDPRARRGLELFEQRVSSLWSAARQVDLEALSRYQIEATRGYQLPAEPGPWSGRAVALDEAGIWHLELRGPRLPARFDIVYRYLTFYTTFDPRTEELGPLTLTLRSWVLE